MTEQEVRDTCKKYDEVREIFKRAELAVQRHPTSYDRSTYGTKVHTEAAHEINGSIIDPVTGTKRFRMSYEAQDPNFVAEVSIFEAVAGKPAPMMPESLKQKRAMYRMGGTVRLDVLENVDGKNDLVCVYDFKTGEDGMGPKRFREIQEAVWQNFPLAKRLVIIEMRSRPPGAERSPDKGPR